MSFEKNLKQLRINNKKKQSELADVFNISRSTVAKWETGENKPNTDTLEKLADYFNVSVDYLLGRQEIKTSFDTYTRNERDIKLLNAFSKLNNFGKDEALKRVLELSEITRYTNAISPAISIAAHKEDIEDL